MTRQVLCVVRHLALRFLHQRSRQPTDRPTRDMESVLAFAVAESQKQPKRRMVSFSPIALPFWVVQVSPTSSIVVSGTAQIEQTIDFTEKKRLNDFRRVLTSEIGEPADILRITDRLVEAAESGEKVSQRIAGLIDPQGLKAAGKLVEELEPSDKYNELELRADSQRALSTSENFRRIIEASRLRVDTLEELRRVASEKLMGQLTVLDNITTADRNKWTQRVRQMEDRTRLDTEGLRKKQKDTEYSLREKQKTDLRALTAELARSTSDIERFFGEILEKVRQSRIEIGRRGDDVDGAVTAYHALASELMGTVPRYTDTIKLLNKKCDDLLASTQKLTKDTHGEATQVASSTESEISARGAKLDDLRSEMQKNLDELEDLRRRVGSSADRVLKAVSDSIAVQQEEFLRLMSFAIDNDSIAGLTPLTQLTLSCFAARFDDGSVNIVTPFFVPEDRIGQGFKPMMVSSALDEFLGTSMDSWLKQSPNFKFDLQSACVKGNLFAASDGRMLLSEGLASLERRQLLREGFRETLQRAWESYATSCPRCGAEVKGAAFCPKCGASLKG